MEANVSAALLTLSWVIAQGKFYWQDPKKRRVPVVENPDPKNESHWETPDNRKLLLDIYRQFNAAVEQPKPAAPAPAPKRGGRPKKVEKKDEE